MPSIQKVFGPYPFAHRAWAHDGQCKFIHGHNWTFTAKFSGEPHPNDLCGFLVDFGKFDALKRQFEREFDHSLILAEDDPLLPTFFRLQEQGACKLGVLPHTSSEAIASYVFKAIQIWLSSQWPLSAQYPEGWTPPILTQVEVRESDNNSAIAYA